MGRTILKIGLLFAALLIGGCGKKGDILEDDLIVKTGATNVSAEEPSPNNQPKRDFILDRIL